jgi:nucleotide-binding universal stress UspA family protein
MRWKTIVVGYDETDPAKRALEQATELAKLLEANLVVASIAPLLVGMAASRGIGPYDPADPPEEHREELEHARDFLVDKGVAAEFELAVGHPGETIVELAEKHGAELIVVGTREPGLLERLFGGSVSASVSKHAHCDVLVVH